MTNQQENNQHIKQFAKPKTPIPIAFLAKNCSLPRFIVIKANRTDNSRQFLFSNTIDTAIPTSDKIHIFITVKQQRSILNKKYGYNGARKKLSKVLDSPSIL